MRRLSLAMVGIAMAALVTMVSCRKPKLLNDNTVAPRTMTFNAKTEMGENKTSLDGFDVNWSAGDQLKINGEPFTLSSGAGTTFGGFTSDGEVSITSPYYAAYPATATYDAGTLTFNLSATPAYDATEVAIPMVAVNYSELTTLYFKNVVNVLKLRLTGDGTDASKLTSIVLTSTTSNLNGDFTVTFDGDTPNVGAANGTSTTTLSFGDTGLELASGETTNVYIVLPKIAGGDLRIKFNCANGKYMKKGITVTSAFNAVNNMLTAPEFAVNATTSPVDAPSSVTTTAGCSSGNIYTFGGTVTLTAAQEVEYGFVCSENVDVPEVGAANCFKIVGGVADMPAGTTNFTVDITGLTSGHTYHVRAYAIGENLTPVQATGSGSVKSVIGSNTSQPVNWNGDPLNPVPGASPYEFTVASGRTVRFSQGNLQYVATGTHAVATGGTVSGTWRFADHQFDFLGKTTGQDSEDQGKTRDLFGWGTSGYHQGTDTYNTNYMPYSTSTSTVNMAYNYYGYGPSTNRKPEPIGPSTTVGNISGSYYDWGVYNAIINGGDAAGMWRTLTYAEWNYLINTRENAANLYGEGRVGNCTHGLIILPDGWTTCPSGLTFTPGASNWANVYSFSDWSRMESAGAVFLPAAGRRVGTKVDQQESYGHYWSSSYSDASFAYLLYFYINHVTIESDGYRHYGRPVRLVH